MAEPDRLEIARETEVDVGGVLSFFSRAEFSSVFI